MYESVLDVNEGEIVAVVTAKPERVESVAAAVRVTIKVYVFVVPFCAVTTTAIAFAVPAVKAIEPDTEAEVTEIPFTVTVAWDSLTVGVRVIDDVV